MRNRSEGWKFAKTGGHKLEDLLKAKLKTDINFSSELHKMVFGKPFCGKAEASGGGKGAKKAPSVLEHLTQPKSDLSVKWENGATARISIKKSLGGQVWLISHKNFLAAFDKHYGIYPEKRVVECLGYFIGAPGFGDRIEFKKLNLKGPRHRSGKPLEVHQRRLCAETIIANFPMHWEETMRWLNAHIGNITELCFARGLCKYEEDQANHLWYFDLKQEKTRGINQVLAIKDILHAIERIENPCVAGEKNAGSTIQTPFGFLQMHSPGPINELQFHHSYFKISELLKKNDKKEAFP